ncbi:MAG: hypothetical protein EXS64_19875 [Candidatus Latescibacteria bacterium]|nr:hypothetical protein [Candidatus Latescibacterota bacterium]
MASREEGARRRTRWGLPVSYRLNRLVHNAVFDRDAPGFQLGREVYRRIEKAGKKARAIAHAAEQAVKVLAFDCRDCGDCGDCSLPEIAYLCPESQCVKNQRNGPCGGTRQGQCEVGEKPCIWALAYDRLKAYGQEEAMLRRPAVFRDAALRGTSAWANTFLGRDNHAKNNRET